MNVEGATVFFYDVLDEEIGFLGEWTNNLPELFCRDEWELEVSFHEFVAG